MKNQILLSGYVIMVLLCSCMKHGGLYREPEPGSGEEKSFYIYPFEKEDCDYVAEITVQTKGNIDLEQLEVEILQEN